MGKRSVSFGKIIAAALVLLFVVSAKPVNAEEVSQSATEQYIVVLKDGVSAQGLTGSPKSVAAEYGGAVKREFKAIKGASVALSPSAAERLAKDKRVAYVEKDGVVQTQAVQTPVPSWGLDRLAERNLPLDNRFWYPTDTGKVTAYVVDTGLLTTHQDFGSRAKSGYDFIDEDETANDCNGHGTHVAGTIGGTKYGAAKQVKLVGVKVLNCDGQGSFSSVIAGVDWIAEHAAKPAVVNMSLSGGRSRALNDALQKLIDKGVAVVVAAGNYDDNSCQYSPSSLSSVITVGATDRKDARSWFSNYGSCVDIFAPGEDITSDWWGSNTQTLTLSGTSMASPHVAAGAAMILAKNPQFTPAQVDAALKQNASLGIVTNIDSVVRNTPNRLLYTGENVNSQPILSYCSKSFSQGKDVILPDVEADGTTHPMASSLTVTDCNQKASKAAKVTVDIEHPDRGDIKLQLRAPDGTVYGLKDADMTYTDNSPFVKATFLVNLSDEMANGSWTLIVTDEAEVHSGTLKHWSLAL